MTRRARLSIPGIPWHIIQRGNNKTACFYSNDDYEYYLYLLKEQALGRRVTKGKSGRPVCKLDK